MRRITPRPPVPPEWARVLNLQEILNLDHQIYGPAVYFLLLEGTINYVGISETPLKRFEQHRNAGRIPFDETMCMPNWEPQQRKILERLYIRDYNPPYNLQRRGAARE